MKTISLLRSFSWQLLELAEIVWLPAEKSGKKLVRSVDISKDVK